MILSSRTRLHVGEGCILAASMKQPLAPPRVGDDNTHVIAQTCAFNRSSRITQKASGNSARIGTL
jgi:hypothetical protein